MTLFQALRTQGSRSILFENGVVLSAVELLSAAEAMAASLRVAGYDRLLIRSGSARPVLLVLVTAEILGADLVLAPADMPDPALIDIGATLGITDEFHLMPEGLPARLLGARRLPPVDDGIPIPRIMLMTSGTTGPPKVASHTFASLAAHIRRTEASATARWLLTFPAYTFAGLQVLFTSVLGGGRLIVPGARNPTAFVEAAVRHAVTHVSGTPTFWRAFLMAAGETGELPDLRQIVLGGEAADQPTLNRIRARFPSARVGHIYASTEVGALFHVQDGREGFPALWLEEGPEGIGLRIRDEMLEVHSPRRMQRYLSGHADPVTSDGWIRTGDLVRVEDDRVVFAGRSDARINVAGYKVAPEEVEAALLAVEGVVEAGVTAVPSPITGQALVAEIVCAPGVDSGKVRAAAIRHLKAKLEPYKVPRIFRFVEAISSASSGKKARRVIDAG